MIILDNLTNNYLNILSCLIILNIFYLTKYKYLTSTDTIIKVDSVPKIITLKETREVEVNHIYWYQKILMWFGVIAMGIILIYLLYKLKLR